MFEKLIYSIRGDQVMLSHDLANLYRVEVRSLIQAVKRNRNRFPRDFMFQLTQKEYANLKSHFVISSWGGARRARPYAFTEQGIAMLSSVLKSSKAVEINIKIMRVLVKLRRLCKSNREFAAKLEHLDEKTSRHDVEIRSLFDAIQELLEFKEKPKREIGFHA